MLAYSTDHSQTDEEESKVEGAAWQAPVIGLFHDIPRWIWSIFLAAWGSFFGLMLAFFATSPTAAFMVVVATLFGLMAFGLPMALAAQSGCVRGECRGPIDTYTGPVSPAAAAAQIALIPVAVVVGLAGFILLAL
jgi:hypothetical protein